MYETGFIEQFGKDISQVSGLDKMKWIFDKKGSFSFASDAQGYKYLQEKIVDALTTKKIDFLNAATLPKIQQLFKVSSVDEAINKLKDETFFKTLFQIL